jgi:hypothetical protein
VTPMNSWPCLNGKLMFQRTGCRYPEADVELLFEYFLTSRYVCRGIHKIKLEHG